ncbi:MAG: hypothetical protein GY811_07180 [Myxococcales bacterium]|nr:hypothetical protein [Myxococcales bacterium]
MDRPPSVNLKALPIDSSHAYLNMKGSRGQVARLLFDLGDIEVENIRSSFQEFMSHKESYPFGAIPILEVDGQVIAQCNGINRYLGKLAKMYPNDPLQAALCDEAMSAVGDTSARSVLRRALLLGFWRSGKLTQEERATTIRCGKDRERLQCRRDLKIENHPAFRVGLRHC